MQYVTSWERIAKEEGEIEGEIKGIELGLDLKFGPQGLELMEEIKKIDNLTVLQQIFSAIKPSKSLEEIRSMYKNYFSNPRPETI